LLATLATMALTSEPALAPVVPASSATDSVIAEASVGASLVLATVTVKLAVLLALMPPLPCAPALPSRNTMFTVMAPERSSATLA